MPSKDFKLPDLGEGVHEGQIVRVMVKPGDVVREDQPMMEVETDKAAAVIPCPFSGTVEKVHVHDGQMVHVGDVMVTIGDSKARASNESNARGPATSMATGARSPATRQVGTTAKGGGSISKSSTVAMPTRHKSASPAVRKLARSLNIDIETINGSGPGGRVQRTDVEQMVNRTPQATLRSERASLNPTLSLPATAKSSSAAPPSRAVAARVSFPAVPESRVIEPQGEDASDQYGPIKRAPLTQARKTIAQVMVQSWTSIPHATDFDDADVTELDKIRKGYTPPDDPNRTITLLAFVIRAVVRTLQRFPDFNAHYDEKTHQIIYKRYINIAVGVHTERGLVPMVLRNADHMSIPQIGDELNIIGEKARTATFAVNDTRGGTYTISNAGAMGGSRYSTPIITPGQAAVLAIGRTRWMPWVVETESPQTKGLSPRLIMPLSHSIDHRLLDGGQEVQFMQHVIGDLQNPARLLL